MSGFLAIILILVILAAVFMTPLRILFGFLAAMVAWGFLIYCGSIVLVTIARLIWEIL